MVRHLHCAANLIERTGNALSVVFCEDFGSLRGQGKRISKQVVGGMFDSTLQGKKYYTDLIGKLKESEPRNYQDAYSTLSGSQSTLLLSKYGKGRSAGFDHDIALLYALSCDYSVAISFEELLTFNKIHISLSHQQSEKAKQICIESTSSKYDEYSALDARA